MNIGEANDAATIVHFLSGRDNDPDRALAAATRLAERAEKPLLLAVLRDVEKDRIARTLDDIAASRP